MIAGRGFAVAEKYATSMILIPANKNPRKYNRRPVCAYSRRSWLFSLLNTAINGSVKIQTSATMTISIAAAQVRAQRRSFFTSSAAPLPKLSLIRGCAPCAIPFMIAIPTSERFATTPYAATPVLPVSPRISILNINVITAEEISPTNADTPS